MVVGVITICRDVGRARLYALDERSKFQDSLLKQLPKSLPIQPKSSLACTVVECVLDVGWRWTFKIFVVIFWNKVLGLTHFVLVFQGIWKRWNKKEYLYEMGEITRSLSFYAQICFFNVTLTWRLSIISSYRTLVYKT